MAVDGDGARSGADGAETAPPTPPTADAPERPTPDHHEPRREADWTLVQLSGGQAATTIAGRPVTSWTGQWVALNQRGDVYLYGAWADCWESARYWATRQPPRGAAYGETGHGWRGPVPGLDAPDAE